MFKPDKTLLDAFRRQRRIETDPMAALKGRIRSGATPIVSLQPPHPMVDLVTDPFLDLAKAEQDFYAHQIATGMELINDGIRPQTAADEQNLRAIREDRDRLSLTGQENPIVPPAVGSKSDAAGPRGYEPHNDPFSTVPGSMGFNPMKPPGWFPPGA